MPGPVRSACLSSIWGLYLRIYYTPACATLEGVPMGPLRKPEVMSPAGYWPQLRAAIEAGADAVYFGLKHFTARAKVGFSLAELPEVMATLHRRGVKGYITSGNSASENPTLARAVKCLSPKYTASAPASMAARSWGQYPAGLMTSGLPRGPMGTPSSVAHTSV